MADSEEVREESAREKFERLAQKQYVDEKNTSNTYSRREAEIYVHILKGEDDLAKKKLEGCGQKLSGFKHKLYPPDKSGESEESRRDETPVMCEVFPEGSKRGAPLLVDSLGYSYNKKPEDKRHHTATVVWTCNVRRDGFVCPAKVHERDGKYIAGVQQHRHDPPEPRTDKFMKFFSNIKHKVKMKGFMYMPGIGLVLPEEPGDISSGFKKMAVVEDFWDILTEVHNSENHGKPGVTHTGRRTLFLQVKQTYFGLPRSAVDIYCKLCTHCQVKRQDKAHSTVRLSKPCKGQRIISARLFEHVQVGFIDMQNEDGYCSILHAVDAFSRFHFLWPIQTKSQGEVYAALSIMFSMCGLPEHLHLDNSLQVLQVELLMIEWNEECKVVYGATEHQATVRRYSSVVTKKLKQFVNKKWYQALPLVNYQLNTTYCSTFGRTPYEMVFGRNIRGPRNTVTNPNVASVGIEVANQEDLVASTNFQEGYIEMPINIAPEVVTMPTTTSTSGDYSSVSLMEDSHSPPGHVDDDYDDDDDGGFEDDHHYHTSQEAGDPGAQASASSSHVISMDQSEQSDNNAEISAAEPTVYGPLPDTPIGFARKYNKSLKAALKTSTPLSTNRSTTKKKVKKEPVETGGVMDDKVKKMVDNVMKNPFIAGLSKQGKSGSSPKKKRKKAEESDEEEEEKPQPYIIVVMNNN